MDGITGFRYNGSYYYYERNLQGDITAIYNAYGTLFGEYSYDAWGNCSVEYDYNGIASVNPFRYRGYYYDSETGLYYLKSRYYDPQTGRFINADELSCLGANGGVLGYNLYAYCGNNPVVRVDSTGRFWSSVWEFFEVAVSETVQILKRMTPVLAGMGVGTLTDGPLPVADILLLVAGALIIADAVAQGTYQAIQIAPISIPKVKTKEDVTAFPPSTSTVIYRYYASKTENLSPRPGIDYDGLSFSTVPPRAGVSAVVTTIEQVNATGVLLAIPTGGTHVIIVPTNGTVEQWMDQGQASIWTQALSAIAVEWNGGF